MPQKPQEPQEQQIKKLIEEHDQNVRIEHLANVGGVLLKGGLGEARLPFLLTDFAVGHFNYTKDADLSADVDMAVSGAKIRQFQVDGKNLQSETESWVELQTATFWLRDGYIELGLATKATKKHFRTCIKRCEEKGMCKPLGGGKYRVVNKELSSIEIIEQEFNEYAVKLPLDLDEWGIIRPSNIIVVAGEKGSGKSAFCLNAALKNMNQNGMEIKYFSSEMRDSELIPRLKLFEPEIMLDEWAKSNIEFFYRKDDFHDVIDPDGFNIIDYLEITDNFYRIAADITEIFDKLDKGIALIALQKDPEKQLGRGGTFSMEKSRMYITLHNAPPEGNIAKIQDIKTWRRSDMNPNYRSCNFKLINGAKMAMIGDWVRMGGKE
jgi:hypothetical protein